MDYFLMPLTYGAKHKDENTRANSRSGGVFTAISDYVLGRNGIIYGSVMDEQFLARHKRATTSEERDAMRGSKYIQSFLGDTFESVKKDLLDGRYVLFTGTSCQVKGLKNFLDREYDNLICMDILCRGVPSPLVWKKYLDWRREKNGKITNVSFRNKADFGWKRHVETLTFEDGRRISSCVFADMFRSRTVLRPCCYDCKFKNYIHPADITIGDFWEIDNIAPEFNDNMGVSLIMVNNEKGRKVFDLAKDGLHCIEVDAKSSFKSSMLESYPEPKRRRRFWKDFYSLKFGRLVMKYELLSYADKGINKARRILRLAKKGSAGQVK